MKPAPPPNTALLRVGALVALSALSIIAGSAAAQPAASAPLRMLDVQVEFSAEQDWESHTEEHGHEFWHASTEQRWSLRTPLVASDRLYALNLLDEDLQTRLKAKTLHLARKALRQVDADGQPIGIPRTRSEKQALTRRMEEEQYACGGDAECRRALMERYAAIFAAMQYPDALQADDETGRYRYFEPAEDCRARAQVRMSMTVEGERYDPDADAVVAFAVTRAADATNPGDDVPLCQRYLATLDSQADAQPMYLENFYLPSAQGTTTVESQGTSRDTTERQPMPVDVLRWVTQQLRHAPVRGQRQATIELTHPVNGISEDSGRWSGTADVELRWSFAAP